MRHVICLGLALAASACQAGRSTPVSYAPPANPVSQTTSGPAYLSVLDGNTIYPMPQPTDIRLRAFPEAPSPFTLTDKLSDENGNVLVTLTDTMDGTMSAQAVGSDIELTIRVNDESVGTGSSLVAPKYTHNSGTMQVLRSSDGVINRVSMPKSGFIIWPH